MKQRLVVLVSIVMLGTAATKAGAAPSPVTGTINCTLSATSTFSPPLGYDPGLTGRHVAPNAPSTWRMDGTLIACSGTQSGGRPLALPIDHGTIRVIGRAADHECGTVAASGLQIRRIRIKWFSAAGRNVGTTIATQGTVAVSNVGLPFPLFPPDPPAGPPQFVAAVPALPTAQVFPGETLTMAALGDSLSYPALPCSTTFSGPPLPQGIPSVTFSGVSGPSTISITP